MSYFDRTLVKNLRMSLEKDDMRTQASRINGMMTTVALFVQKLSDAKEHIAKISSLENEIRKLKNNHEQTDQLRSELSEKITDLEEAKNLEKQFQKSIGEVKNLKQTATELNSILRKL